jgi:transposase-like protein
MDEETYATFKLDIQANGCREPIRTFQGMILDGRNRYRACVELGIDPPMYEFGGDEEDAAKAVESWNLHRRHLTPEFRRQRVAELRGQGMSTREIASEMDIHQTQVVRDIKKMLENTLCSTGPEPIASSDGEPTPTTPSPLEPAPAKVTGRDGKSYLATRPTKARSSSPENDESSPSTQPDPEPTQPTSHSTREVVHAGLRAVGVEPDEFKAAVRKQLSRLPELKQYVLLSKAVKNDVVPLLKVVNELLKLK